MQNALHEKILEACPDWSSLDQIISRVGGQSLPTIRTALDQLVRDQLLYHDGKTRKYKTAKVGTEEIKK